MISVAERILTTQLQKEFDEKGINLTVEQWKLLFYLWDKDGENQRDLVVRAKKEKSTITRQLRDLEKKDLIERRSGIADKRNKLIFLTDKGAGLKKITLNIADKITRKAEDNINKEDLKVLKEVLSKIIDNVENI